MTPLLSLPNELLKYVNEWKFKRGSLIMVLHSVQDYYGYVSKDMCFFLAEELKIPLARIYEVLTFYNYFKLEMPAKYKISACMGTACYLKGAPAILETIKNELAISEGKVTKDGLFGLESVRCFGCCGLAPVVSINGKLYGKLNKDKILDILAQYRAEG